MILPRWDIFCRVIDNFGDIGVCWRLAADLALRGYRVRLWADDARALAWMAPEGAAGVQVLPWPHSAPPDGPGDVVIEAFGCEIAPEFIASFCPQRPPVWINLEYLSAEDYVGRCHRLPSALMSGPGAGLTRWFFYPGFTAETGGLLREPHLATRQAAFDRPAWRKRYGVAEHTLAISLFCYEPPALGALWTQALPQRHVHLLVTPGRASAAVAAALPHYPPVSPAAQYPLTFSYLAPCSQNAFDEMLWACDLNLVRGEDSLVRALWAGQALVWHIYPQHDDAHHDKLRAFLDWLQAPASLRQFHWAWNGLQPPHTLPRLEAALLQEWHTCIQAARQRLLRQPDLLTQLLGFVAEKS